MEYFKNVVCTYLGDECLIWPFWRNNYGYGCLRVDGKDRLVSRVLCEAINGSPPSPKHDTAHSCGNGNKGCVTARHIRWATRVENEADKVKHGTSNRGEQQGNSKLTTKDIMSIRTLNSNGISQPEIAKRFNVSQSHISRIIGREAWHWLE
jgi:predicted XRE-type DNA-binding protein